MEEKLSKGKVLVGMSGGVDSSVAAFLLKEEGYEVTGCTLRLYDYTGIGLPEQNSCCGINEVNDARAVAERIGIDFRVINFMTDFRREVMDKFVREYECGHTPNPCIDCNRTMKFGKMRDYALENGFDYIATGHYAQKVAKDGRYYLKKGVDPTRDQSYVLYPISQETLKMFLLPLGGLIKKTGVRRIAEEQGFVNAHKHDSEDICFVPDGDYAGLISRMTGRELPDGQILDEDGNVMGTHHGAVRYTIGQRRGLGLALPEPVYVLDRNIQKNTVTVGPEKNLFRTTFRVSDLTWMRPEPQAGETFRAASKIRYRQKEQPSTITCVGPDTVEVVFDEPQRAITSGQAAVFYDGDLVIGGGTIQ